MLTHITYGYPIRMVPEILLKNLNSTYNGKILFILIKFFKNFLGKVKAFHGY